MNSIVAEAEGIYLPIYLVSTIQTHCVIFAKSLHFSMPASWRLYIV